MKKKALLMVTAVSLLASIAQAVDHPDRPAGVGEKDWVQISERLGFVLDQKEAQSGVTQSRQVLLAPPESVSAELLPPAKGYFVMKTSRGWQRMVVSE